MKNVVTVKLSGAASAQNAYSVKSGDETARRQPTAHTAELCCLIWCIDVDMKYYGCK